MAKICSDSYQGVRSHVKWEEYFRNACFGRGATDVSIVEVKGTTAAIVEYQDYSVIVFRGTDQVSDWIDNLHMQPTDANPQLFPGRVHSGFRNHAKRVFRPLMNILERGKPVHVTGHSLGGACAELTAAMIVNQQSQGRFQDVEIEGVYAFCPPRPGLRDFIKWYNKVLGDRTYVFVNKNDIIPHLPSALPETIKKIARWTPGLRHLNTIVSRMPVGYRHPEHTIYIDADDKLNHHPSPLLFLKGFTRGLLENVGNLNFDLIDDHNMYLLSLSLEKIASLS